MTTASKISARPLGRWALSASAISALAVIAISSSSAAQNRTARNPTAQADDGWDYSETNRVHLASVAYDEGRAIGVRCSGDALEVLLLGLSQPPVRRPDTLQLDVAFDGDAAAKSTWLTLPGQPALFATRPAYVARRLRDAGAVAFRIDDQASRLELPLPSDGGAVDRVLSACGQPLTDSRDALQEIDPRPEGVPNRLWARLPNLGSIPADVRYDFVVVSCIVGPAHRLTACRSEMQQPSGRGGALVARALESGRLNPAAALPEGRILVALVQTSGRYATKD